MVSGVSFEEKLAHWAQSGKWSGVFKVEWVFVKDVPNREFKSIIIASNEMKPVTNSRDTQEVPFAEGLLMLNIFKKYRPASSLLDEFELYDTDERKRKEAVPESFGRVVSDRPRARARGSRSRGRPRGRGREDVEPAQPAAKEEKAELVKEEKPREGPAPEITSTTNASH